MIRRACLKALGLGTLSAVAADPLAALQCWQDYKGRPCLHPFVLRDGKYKRVKPEEVKTGDEMIMIGMDGDELLGAKKFTVGQNPYQLQANGIIQVMSDGQKPVANLFQM